jgi:hypothetical protein
MLFVREEGRRRRLPGAMRERRSKRAASVGYRAPAIGGGIERTCFSFAKRDDDAGFPARCVSGEAKGGSR